MIAVSKNEPAPENRECKFCKCEVVSNETMPMCDDCRQLFEAKVEAEAAKTAEANANTSLAQTQIDVFMRGCATQQQAAAIVDHLIERFGGAQGFANQWYDQMSHVLTQEKGTTKALNMMRDFAKFMLQVSKVSMEQLSQIDDMDMAELEQLSDSAAKEILQQITRFAVSRSQ